MNKTRRAPESAEIRARSVLIIIGLAMFIAAGLDPIVGWSPSSCSEEEP